MLAVSVACLLSVAGAAPAFAGTMPTANIPIDGTPQVEAASAHPALLGAPLRAVAPSAPAPLHDGLAPDLTLTLPDLSMWGGTQDVPFWKEWSGAHTDVYVAWDDLAAPADSAQQYQTITADDVAYMGGEFDQRIWPSDVFHFGRYADRSPAPGIDGSRIAIMIYNIRDDAYYSSDRSAMYVGGYFDATVDDTENLNAVFVDSFDWPHGTKIAGSIPYRYEGTVAHEFAHLIQHDVDPSEDQFVKEGLAELATQFLYGPQATSAEVGEYLFYHRDSLTDWKDELYDYGGAALWQDYLWERRGGGVLADRIGCPAPAPRRVKWGHSALEDSAAKFADPGDRFIWQEMHDPATGLQGIADQLPGGMATVEPYFRDWTLANLLDGQVWQPQWNYRNLVLGGPDSAGLSIADGVKYYDSGATTAVPPTRKPVERTIDTEAWAAYYTTFSSPPPRATVTFSGDRAEGVLPPTGTYEWFSGSGDNLERTLTRRIDGVKAGDVLTFQTWYDIEEGFDFGYVEASANGQDWTLLQQLSSLPAFAENTYESTAWSGPGGLTGATGGWQQARYSLSGFTGTVYLRFRYATDFFWEQEGWYIDDIAVGSFVDPVDTTNGWITDPNDPWLFTDGVKQTNDWTADVYVPHPGRWWSEVTPVVPVVGTGTSGSARVDTHFFKDGVAWGIVSNHPDGGMDAQGSLVVSKKGR